MQKHTLVDFEINEQQKTVLLIGFILDESPIADKIRKLITSGNDDIFLEPIKAEPTKKQHNDIVVPVSEDEPNGNEIVVVQNNQAVTTSLQVAEVFGKRHDNVLQDIKNFTTENSGVKNMFHETTYKNERGREYPMFYMNRDGFTLLAMGFTGKKAMQFKLKYIEQFNQMEEQLKSQAVAPVASYMIDDPIKRAEMWIAEQREKVLLEETVEKQNEVIDHKQEVIHTLTVDVPLAFGNSL